MTSTTYDQFAWPDPTKTFLFKCTLLLERLVSRAKLRILIEISRLLLLGFYEDFRVFVRTIERAEERSNSEGEFKTIWKQKAAVAGNLSRLTQQLRSLDGLRFRGKDLLDYAIGRERLEEFRLFIELTDLEGKAENMMDYAKGEFVKSFAKRTLTRNQRAAFLEKYAELNLIGTHAKTE